MIIDTRQVPSESKLACDVAVIGSGPAGLSLALELAQTKASVIVLEAGGEHYSRREQDHFRGEVVDPSTHHPLDQYRVRQFGGGSNLWGGRCAPYEDIDFERRDWVGHSGWPISNREVESFYERASDHLDLGAFCYDASECLVSEAASVFPGMVWDSVTDRSLWRYSLPTNVRRKHRRRIESLANLRLLLHASCLELRTSEDGVHVTSAVVGSGGNRLSVSSRFFVLACGAIETARLLMVSRDRHAGGLGNTHDQVGRYYQSHLYGSIAKVVYLGDPRSVRYGFERAHDGVYVQHMLRPRAAAQREAQLLNFCAVLNNADFNDPSHGAGVLSSMFLVKWLISRRLPLELTQRGLVQKHRTAQATLELVGRHAWNVVRDVPSVAQFSWEWLTKRILSRRKLPGVKLRDRRGEYHLLYSAEQEPNPDSRVRLSHKRDAFGYNQSLADWRFTQRDIDSIVKNHVLLAKDISNAPRPVLSCDVDFATLADRARASANVGSHHIGTARMATTPREGVVDSNCLVHGMANLYIAGSATFPTSSCVSVTFMIVALALRVADDIRRRLSTA